MAKALGKPAAVLVDDHPAVLTAVRSLLQDEFEIVTTAVDGRQALAAVSAFHPELIVLDMMMTGWNGFETAQRIIEVSPFTKVLFLTVVEDVDYMAKAREIGASYVIKRRIRCDLLTAALQLLAGNLFFSPL